MISKKKNLAAIISALIGTVAVICSFTVSGSRGKDVKTDKDGHVLSSLWADYSKAYSADMPQEAEKILEKILKESKSSGYAWDFYDGLVKWYEAATRVSWKRYDECRERMARESAEFGSPVVSYRLISGGYINGAIDSAWLEKHVVAKKGSLEKGRNKRFYQEGGNYAGFIAEYISNDYEYLLWAAAFEARSSAREEATALLSDYVGTAYPNAAYLEFRGISGSDVEKKPLLEAFHSKYSDRAISLLASQELICMRMREINRAVYYNDGDEVSSDDCRKFREECSEFERLRKSFSAKEPEIAKFCTEVEGIISQLDARTVSIDRDGLVIYIRTKNVDKVSMELRKGGRNGEVVRKASINNPVCSYYIVDTLRYDFVNDFADGDYFIVCTGRGEKCERSFPKHSISIAGRTNASGAGVFAAHCVDGRPLDKADVEFLYKGEVAGRVPDVKFNGFVSVQETLAQLRKKHPGSIVTRCSFTDENGIYRCSDAIYVDDRAPMRSDREYAAGRVFKDRSAFNPGDTVRFKAILYLSMGGKDSLMPAGTHITASFCDPDTKEVASIDLVTNEFGSVAGEFIVPKDAKGGRYFISISDKNNIFCTSSLIVDEFVLPTYSLEFEKDEAPYFNGDTVVVRGRLRSYSGHSLSSAKVLYSAYCSLTKKEDIWGEVHPDNSGIFEISFPSQDAGSRRYSYYVMVKVIDQTGETMEWHTRCMVEPVIEFNFTLENKAEAEMSPSGKVIGSSYLPFHVVCGDVAKFNAKACVYDGNGGEILLPVNIRYRVIKGDSAALEGAVASGTVVSGTVASGSVAELNLSGLPSGLYRVEAEGEYSRPDGKTVELKHSCNIFLSRIADKRLDSDVKFFAKKYSGMGICLQVGCSDGPGWFVAELYDDNANLLKSEMIRVEDKSVRLIEYEFRKDYPETVNLQIFGFRGGEARQASFDYSRSEMKADDLILEFASFTDKSLPDSECEFVLKTVPGAECVAAVFDIASETLSPNRWEAFKAGRGVTPLRSHVRCSCGNIAFEDRLPGRSGGMNAIPFATVETKAMFYADLTTPKRVVMKESATVEAEEDAASMADVAIRENFSNTLAFLPFLRPDKKGNVRFSVKTSDKLSTYCVQVFAHDRNLSNAAIRRDMVVTMPLKVSVVEPQFLYEGDVYRLRASVANGMDSVADGTLRLYVYDTADHGNAVPLKELSMSLSVPGGESASGEFEIPVPHASVLGFKVVYKSKMDGKPVSDGLFVTVPVRSPAQKLTEAHSAVLLDGMDRDSLRLALASQFTGVSAEGAEYREVKLLDMILESIPDKVEPASDNIFALLEAYYVGRMAEFLGGAVESDSKAVLEKILACGNPDGGFSWFDGFNSSLSVTSFVLESMALLKERTGECGIPEERLAAAVKYIDSQMIDPAYPLWYSGLSTMRYLYVRSMYPQVKFEPKAASKALKKFRKEASEYLLPAGKRTLPVYSNLYVKFMRASTAFNLSASESKSLASALGLSQSKLSKSVSADMSSFFEYAVKHSSGGEYYPNAVMPLRGMLETEAYAHSMICDLMDRYSKISSGTSAARAAEIADGIRLWLMVQKETQKWYTDNSYINAVNSVLGGSDSVKSAAIAILSKSYESPFSEIRSAGNGFSIERKFYREKASARYGSEESSREEIKDGEILSVGDKIVAEYKVWSEENRSLVVLSAPRHAALRPVKQLSGVVWDWIRPLSISGGFSLTPCSYREVKSDRTIWYMEVCPEEKSSFYEEFYVTSAGTFTSPVVTIESVYAPEYRANDKFGGLMSVAF